MFNLSWPAILIMSLPFVNCERAVLFPVTCDLEPFPLLPPTFTTLFNHCLALGVKQHFHTQWWQLLFYWVIDFLLNGLLKVHHSIFPKSDGCRRTPLPSTCWPTIKWFHIIQEREDLFVAWSTNVAQLLALVLIWLQIMHSILPKLFVNFNFMWRRSFSKLIDSQAKVALFWQPETWLSAVNEIHMND